MKNKQIINNVLKVYASGGNWRQFLKQQVRNRRNELLTFDLGQTIKLRAGAIGKTNAKRIVKGKVVKKTDYFVIIKTKNYLESFNYTDFLNGKVIRL